MVDLSAQQLSTNTRNIFCWRRLLTSLQHGYISSRQQYKNKLVPSSTFLHCVGHFTDSVLQTRRLVEFSHVIKIKFPFTRITSIQLWCHLLWLSIGKEIAAQRRDDLRAQFRADMQNHRPHELIFIDETGFVSRRKQNCFALRSLVIAAHLCICWGWSLHRTDAYQENTAILRKGSELKWEGLERIIGA